MAMTTTTLLMIATAPMMTTTTTTILLAAVATRAEVPAPAGAERPVWPAFHEKRHAAKKQPLLRDRQGHATNTVTRPPRAASH